MLDLLRQIGQGIVQLVDSLLSLLSWIPIMLRMSASSGNFMLFVPATLLPIATIIAVFYVLRILMGADNK